MHFLSIFRDRAIRLRNNLFEMLKSGDSRSRESQQRIRDSLPYYRALKDKYRGRRAFVIGNGPSLRLADLELLRDEVTIASNRIYLAFPHVSWRPTIYTLADPLLWTKIREDFPNEISVIHVPDCIDTGDYSGKTLKTWRSLTAAGESREKDDSFSGVEFSSNICEGMYCSWTITFENLQFAVHLGLSPIYIIGCDHYYAGETAVEADKPIVAGEINNHFIAGYRKPGELVYPAPIRLMNRGFAEARIFSERYGIPIYNATRGGCLEAFKRVTFESLF